MYGSSFGRTTHDTSTNKDDSVEANPKSIDSQISLPTVRHMNQQQRSTPSSSNTPLLLLSPNIASTVNANDDVDDGKATLFSCVINLANTIVGAGMLGLPGAFGGTGYLGGREAYFYHQNPRGDVYAISASETVTLQGRTFNKGDIVERYTYSLYGSHKVWTDDYASHDTVPGLDYETSAVGNIFMWGGGFKDNETCFMYMRFRYYDKRLRGFLSRDPLEDDNLGNLYGFVNNNPGSYIDPMGLSDNMGMFGVGPEAERMKEDLKRSAKRRSKAEYVEMRIREIQRFHAEIAARQKRDDGKECPPEDCPRFTEEDKRYQLKRWSATAYQKYTQKFDGGDLSGDKVVKKGALVGREKSANHNRKAFERRFGGGVYVGGNFSGQMGQAVEAIITPMGKKFMEELEKDPDFFPKRTARIKRLKEKEDFLRAILKKHNAIKEEYRARYRSGEINYECYCSEREAEYYRYQVDLRYQEAWLKSWKAGRPHLKRHKYYDKYGYPYHAIYGWPE